MPLTSNILVVDDEEMNLDLCSRRLRRSGFTVAVASSGAQALAMIEESRYALVLLDQMMPEMSGLEVLKTLRRKYSALTLPVIMVTAVTDSARIAEALDAGASDYITKPIDFTVALARIRSQLSRRQTEIALHHSEERYALAAIGTNDGLWDWDLTRNEIYYSPRWKSLLGLPQDDTSNDPEIWFSRVHPRDRERLERLIQSHLAGETQAVQCEYRMKHEDGNYRWMSVRGMAVRSDAGVAHRMAGSQSDVTTKATIDILTQLPNRIMFADRLAAAVDRAQAGPAGIFAVLFLDLDRFKLVNDSMGHAAGDELLENVAERLSKTIRSTTNPSVWSSDSILARLGGDEFAILVENLPDAAAAEDIAARVSDAMRPPFLINLKEVYCSMSIGIAACRPDHCAGEDLLRDADTAMYVAKALGRGRWSVFEPGMRKEQEDKLQMDSDLRRAVENAEFEVFYQSRVKLETGAICGFEALVRWNHPTRGLVPPFEFIPAAEENGLIREIGLWVLREACRQTHEWNLQFPSAIPFDIAVNLSAVQCRDPKLVEKVAEILKETQLPPECLHLELTESLLLESLDETRTILNALKELGVGLKLDDFGMGYSCLKYLAELPFDTLKIDRSFVFNLDRGDRDSLEIVRTILLMAEGLKMGVIAEGIEKIEHVAQLQKMGCRFGQGFYFSLPVPAGAAGELLADGGRARDLLCVGNLTPEKIESSR